MRTILIIIAISLSYITAQSIDFPDSTKQELKSLKDEAKVKLLTDLAWKLREKDTDLALEYGKQAVSLCDSLNITDYAAKAYNFVGVLYMHYKYDASSAIPYLQSGLEISLRTKDSLETGYTYNNLGDVYYLTGNAPLALEYAERSLEYFEKLNNNRGMAYSYINLGLLWRYEKKYALALEYFNKSIELRKTSDYKTGIASATLEIARTYFDKGNLDSAKKYFGRSLELNREIDNKRYMAFSLDGLGDVYYTKGNYNNALKMFNKAIEYNLERNHDYGIISNRLGKALVYSKTNKKQNGEAELAAAISIAEKLGLAPQILEAYETSTKFYLNLKDYQTASNSFDKFLKVYDSLFSRQQFETLSEIESRFRISQKLKETNQELEVKTHEEQYLVIIIILMTILVALLVWRYTAKRKINKKLHQLNESKDKMFAIISHDLKNPFNALIGFIDLLKEENLDEEERKEFIHNLDHIAHNTYKLLENLLNLSASRSGKIEYSPKIIEIEKVVRNILNSVSIEMKKKSLTVDMQIQQEEIFGDENMIEITLRNLITNAIKFSNENGLIKIASKRCNGYYKLSVSDNGIGMSKEMTDRLFTSDFVPSNSGTAGEKGNGLGLSLCNEFITMHGGTISVESTPGTGSEFKIILPTQKL